jgi:hypothetical protein
MLRCEDGRLIDHAVGYVLAVRPDVAAVVRADRVVDDY